MNPARMLRENHAWVLIALTLLLFCTKTLFNFPLWIMSFIGLARVLRDPRCLLRDPVFRLLGAMFLCIWLPQLAALPDALAPAHASETIFPYLHFLFAAIYVAEELRDERTLRLVSWSIAIVLGFWCVDALLQFASGSNLFGYPYTPGQLGGMFYPKIRLGHMLALLAPVYFEILRRHFPGSWWTWLPALLLLAILLLSGKRVAWMMGALGMAAYFAYLFAAGAIKSRRTVLAAGVLAIAALSVLATQHEPLARRIDKTLGIFSQDVSAMDKATAYRLTLWGNTARIAQDHWINGVGPRGFRYAYPEYAASGDVFMKKSGGQTHPHLSVLEIAAETGLPGLCGFLLFWALLLQFAWRSLRADIGAAPWLIAAGIAWLPFNAHLAFYGSYWSSVAWWTLGLGVAVTARKRHGSTASRAFRELAQASKERRAEASFRKARVELVLVIKLGALGDVVMATALLRQLQAHHAGEQISLLTDERFADLFRGWPELRVRAVPRHGLREALANIRWIRSQRFARIYDLQSNDRTGVYCALSGVPERIGNHCRYPYTHHPQTPWRGEAHIFERMLEVLKSAGVPARSELPWLPLSADEAAHVAAWTAGQTRGAAFALLHAGASARHPAKRWPGFAELALALVDANILPVWIGGAEDADQNRALAATAGLDVTSMFSLTQLAALAKSARFAVTNDSGPMHVLSCAGIPLYGLFGPTDWRRNHAIGQRERVIAAGGEKTFRPAPLAELPCSRVLERLRADGLLA